MKLTTLTTGLALAVAGIALAFPSEGQAQKRIEQQNGPWKHRGAGVVFPDRVGQFERISITEFSSDGRDAGVRYKLVNDDGTLSVTVFLYPKIKGVNCAEIFADGASLIAKYPGAQEDRFWISPSPDRSLPSAALSIRFDVPENSTGEGHQASLSDRYLYCPAKGDWLVKYRATWFGGTSENFPDPLDLMSAIDWSAAER